jgi:hypothetical protein
MATAKSAVRVLQRSAARTGRALKPVWVRLKAGWGFLWDHPLLLNAILVVVLALLLIPMVKETFRAYTNCDYLIRQKLSMPSEMCNGVDLLVYKSPGLKDVMDQPMETVRTVMMWGIILLFAGVSLYLTIIINNLKTIVKLITFNKAAWGAFMASMRIWLVIFVVFCALFYFNVTR